MPAPGPTFISCGWARSTIHHAQPPDIHIYTSTKQPWVVLPAGAPAVPEFYKPADYWPAETMARFQAARAG